MTLDKNKSITAITYNHLNLPVTVTKNTGEYIRYTYDASGKKLRQQVYNANGDQQKKTDYAGELYLENDTLKFINHEEGRVIMTGPTPEYQYFLKDHLGNVRTTFTTKVESTVVTATFETAQATTEQSQFIGYANTRTVNSTLFDHTNTGSTHYAERLNGSANEKIGLAKSLSVMPGDTVYLEVYAKYVDASNSSNTTTLNNLISQIAAGTASAGTVIDGAGYATAGSSTFPFAGLSGSGSESGTGPKAYLNYISFNRDYLPILNDPSQTGFIRMTTAAKENGTLVSHERLYAQVIVKQAGYMYIYLSNEESSPVEVYFDDFKVEHIKSPVIQQDDYYPFGLTFNSYQRENGVVNNYTYNGKERQDELDLGWLDYGARMYMSEIGRWGVVDPLADLSRRWSPFSYAYDNPLRFIDPDGMYSTEEWKKDHGITDDDVTNVYTAEKEPDQGGSDKPKVISREEWGARHANKNNSGYQEIEGSAKSYYNTIVLHHSGNADNDRSVNSVQDEHMDEDGYADIGYHFAIDLEGNIYEGRPINIKGEHVKGMNSGKIGIVLLTDLDTNNSGLNIAQKIAESIQGDGTETVPMVESLVKLVRYLRSEYGIEYLGGHHELLKERPCPGNVGLELVDKMRQALKFNNPGGN